jgi:uncharacterized protein YjbK
LQTVYNRNNKKGRVILHKEHEIEFKNLLTKEEFEHLLAQFHLDQTHFHSQTNFYYDTPDNYFKNNKMGFRLRVLNTHNELTLKAPVQKHVMEETTLSISNTERDNIIQHNQFPVVPFLETIKDKDLLACLGSIQTNRAHIPYQNGILFFDHSIYSQVEDFEIEYESQDIENGEKIFLQLLETYQIPIRNTDKKIARLMNVLNSLKG